MTYTARLLLPIVLLAVPLSVSAQTTTWADFSAVSSTGTPISIPLGGGSTVDVEVNTGGSMGLSAADLGPLGSVETGLSYTDLTSLSIFNGGGAGTVSTFITFSNFTPGPSHVRGFFFVSNVAGPSSPITLSSSVSGEVQGWVQAGSTFDAPFPGDLGSAAISWSSSTGTFSTTGPLGNNSKGIVIDLSSLSTVGTVTVQLNQHLDDGINFSIGEESAPPVPLLPTPLLVVLAAALGVAGVASARRAA